MRTFAVNVQRHQGKHIKVNKYDRHTRGMEIEVGHNVPAEIGKSLRWVQTVTSNNLWSKTCGETRVDPFGFGSPSVHKFELPGMGTTCKADDLKPFYWTDTEFSGGQGPGFRDKPSMKAPATGRIWTQFVLALCEITGKNVHHLVAIYWGYDRMADGSVRAAAIRRATMDEMRNHGQALKKAYPTYRYT